jgi:thiosulfate dehydrogenase [quinone] large subunit
MDVEVPNEEARAIRIDGALPRAAIAGVRIVAGLLWLTNVAWKTPPDFRTLERFTRWGVDFPVFAPFSAVIERVILPNMTFFGYLTLITEASLGAFLLLGLATRLWAVVGMLMSASIALTVINAPHEWSWAYYLMFTLHAAVWASAAGRSFGLDGILRGGWLSSDRTSLQLLGRAS